MSFHGLVVSSIVLASILAGPTRLTAQEREPLPDHRGEAMIRVHETGRLSFVGLDMAPDALARVFPTPKGGWAVSAGTFDGEIQLFDARGSPSGRLGGPGKGPGEFGGAVFGASAGGRLWIVDPANGRLSVYSEELSLESERPVPGRVLFVAPSVGSAGVLASGFMAGGELRHVARLSGNEGDDVFGGPIEEHMATRARIHFSAETAGGEVWTVAVQGGVVDILSGDDLSLIERFRLPDEELARVGRPTRSGERPPHLAGVMADGGTLWVLFGVQDPDWSMEDGRSGDPGALLDTRILALDVAERAVVANARIDPLCLPIQGRLLSCVDESAQSIRIVELELLRDAGAS